MSLRAVALHLHCYQPPRDNPWLGAVLREANAEPFHDWNERITAESYRPMTAARLLDGNGMITDARNLYEHCSFDVGPTLHRWFSDHADDVDEGIRAGDDASSRASGHGTAIAHPYVHAILPLAHHRDRATLIRWGVADFRARYGREPEGIWLPETAVDTATLEALADEGIGYTIVAPQQVARVRAPGGTWQDVDAGTLDPTRPYRVTLPSGRSMTVCVFDGPLSRAVAFDRDLLSNGDALGRAVSEGFRDREGPQLLLVATDGETYGHHHRFGEMALARAVDVLESDPALEVMTPGEFLARFPAEHEAELVEPSSWSCAHGVGRWWRDCGCTTYAEPGWNQTWRTPLRDAVDWLRDIVETPWADAAARLLVDPWDARDAYVDVLVHPGDDARSRFLKDHAKGELGQDHADLWGLLELQRHLLMTGTSCSWFFADPASLETAVVLRNAARVVDLARDLLDLDLEDQLIARLADLRSNRPDEGGGAQLWRAWARGAEFRPLDVAAWWAALSLLTPTERPQRLLGYDVEPRTPIGSVTRVAVIEPSTGRATDVTCAAVWGDDGGPHVTVSDDVHLDITYDVTDLPDDVVADLLTAGVPTDGRPMGALLQRAAELGLHLDGPHTRRVDTELVQASARAAGDPDQLADLDAWLILTERVPAHHGRFVAQNLVLSLRDQLPAWDENPERTRAASALRGIAERLGVSTSPSR